MKILTVATRVPQLDAKGDQLVAFHRLNALISNGHQVELICCLISSPSAADEVALSFLQSLGIVCRLVVVSRFVQVCNIVRSLFMSAIPLQSGLFYSSECQRLINMRIQNFDPDVLYLILFRPYINVGRQSKPLVVDFIDSVSLNYERSRNKKLQLLQLLYKMESNRSRRYEKNLARRAAFSFVVANDDAQNIDPKRVLVLYNGVDTIKYSDNRDFAEKGRIIFSGNMNYAPNIEAVCWFCENCWPVIHRSNPEARLFICGANPPNVVKLLATRYPNIIVTGRVANMADELGRSWISIAPMQSGSGMQNKILEAMSCGLPVVSTTIGRGSIEAEPGVEIMVADRPNDFAEYVLRLLNSPELCGLFGSAGRLYVSRNHSWIETGRTFISSIETLSKK